MASKNTRTQNKQALERWRERMDDIRDHTRSIPQNETKEQKATRISATLADYAAFVSYYFPHYATSPCGDFHLQAADIVKSKPRLRALMMWARGHAKSTHFNILIPLWLKALEDPHFHVMVLVGKSQDNANTLISDLQAELKANQRYIYDYGQQIQEGSWQEGNFKTRDGCAFFALGRGQSPRGLRYRQHRPDYIVCDDVDDDQLSLNPDRVSKTNDWVLQALLGTMDMGNGRMIIVGNKISKNSIVQYTEDNPAFTTLRIDALTTEGTPTWHQKYTKAQIDDVIATMGYRRAQSEFFNNPLVEGAVFRREWIHYTTTQPLHNYKQLVAYCDPSFKNGPKADYKAIILVGMYRNQYHILRAFIRKSTIVEMVHWFYDLHQSMPSEGVCQYWMEANFAQDLLMKEFEDVGKKKEYIVPIRKDKRKKPDKHARIENISPHFENGRVYIDAQYKEDTDMMRLVDQLLTFQKGSRGHDDGPDALEGAIYKLSAMSRTDHRIYTSKHKSTRTY